MFLVMLNEWTPAVMTVDTVDALAGEARVWDLMDDVLWLMDATGEWTKARWVIVDGDVRLV